MEADDAWAEEEFATLYCDPSTKVHLRLRFRGDGGGQDAAVMDAVAMIVDGTESRGVYEGCVLRELAVASGRRRLLAAAAADADDRASLCAWYRDARAALLVGAAAGGDAEYAHCLQPDSEADQSSPLLVLSWKLKLRPFGAVTAGYVRLSRTRDCGGGGGGGLLGQVDALLVEPLMGALRTERDRRRASVRDTSEHIRRLTDDNRLLVDKLQSLVDGRDSYERRLTAKFLAVLNSKKKLLAVLRRQLMRDEVRKQLQSTDLSATSDSLTLPGSKAGPLRIPPSRQEEHTVDDVEPMRVDGDAVMTALSECEVFAADTQIDYAAAGLWQPPPVSPPLSSQRSDVQPPRTVPDQDNSQSKKKTVLDDLWLGIL